MEGPFRAIRGPLRHTKGPLKCSKGLLGAQRAPPNAQMASQVPRGPPSAAQKVHKKPKGPPQVPRGPLRCAQRAPSRHSEGLLRALRGPLMRSEGPLGCSEGTGDFIGGFRGFRVRVLGASLGLFWVPTSLRPAGAQNLQGGGAHPFHPPLGHVPEVHVTFYLDLRFVSVA